MRTFVPVLKICWHACLIKRSFVKEVTFGESESEKDEYAITLTAVEYNAIKNDENAYNELVSNSASTKEGTSVGL